MQSKGIAMKEQPILLTVFTPTYNRAHTLPRTYASLKAQNCFCFEWLIVDDGSSDGTDQLVQSWIAEEPPFKIRYIYKQNGGMHSAYNTAYANIDTELNVCIDSDDCLAPGAAEKIAQAWSGMRKLGYAGMMGLDSDMQGNIIGKGFPEDLKETTHYGYYQNGGSGDKKLVFRTDIMKQFPPYPEFEGENYVGISCKFIMIDQKYKLGVLNEVLCNVEYQADGSSHTMFRQYVKNPKGFAYFRKVMMTYPISTKRLITDTIHYVSSSILAKNGKYIQETPRKLLTILCTPLGYLLQIYIKKKAAKQ
jgi:glycosyltransferase involved in cell wall biosynthesis